MQIILRIYKVKIDLGYHIFTSECACLYVKAQPSSNGALPIR